MKRRAATQPTRSVALVASRLAVGGLSVVAAIHLVNGHHDTIQNEAFVGASSSATLDDQVTKAVESVFTVDASKVAASRRQAAELLVGKAVGEYDQLYGPFLKQARSSGVSLSTSVRAVGVTWQRGDQARLLVLADQVGTTQNGQSKIGATQLDVRVQRVDGHWQIADFTLL